MCTSVLANVLSRTETLGGIVKKWYGELNEDIQEYQKQVTHTASSNIISLLRYHCSHTSNITLSSYDLKSLNFKSFTSYLKTLLLCLIISDTF